MYVGISCIIDFVILNLIQNPSKKVPLISLREERDERRSNLCILGLGILAFVLPIVNAIKVNKGEAPSYFMTIRFIS